MFGIGPLELIVIAIVAIVFIGPDKLPDAMRKFGKLFVQVRRQANEVKSSFHEVIHDAERELELEKIRELQAKLQAASPTQLIETTIHSASHPTPPELGSPDSETYDYHESHYADGTFRHNPDHVPLAPDPFAHLPITASTLDKIETPPAAAKNAPSNIPPASGDSALAKAAPSVPPQTTQSPSSPSFAGEKEKKTP